MTFTSSSVIKKLLLLFLVFTGIHYTREFLMPLSIAAILATLFLPFCKSLEQKKVPKGLAVLVCLLVLLLATAGIGALLGWQISELNNDISMIKQMATETGERIQQYILIHLGIPPEKQSQLLMEQQSAVIGAIRAMAGSLVTILVNFILMLTYIFLFLYYRGHIRNFVLRLFPLSQQNEMEQVIYSAAHVSQQYLVGLTKMIVCLWIMYFIGFSIVGVKNALFFAILCGLLEIIPYVGNITGTLLTVLVSAVHGASLPMLGGIVITYATIQFIQGWVLEPIIVGPQVKINPFATIVALVLGELLWGIPGIILAIPLTAIFKIACDHIEPLKPFGFLLGEIDSGKTGSGFIKKIKKWFSDKQH